MKRLVGIVAPLALIAVLLGAWEAACRILAIPAYFLPPPSAVAAALVAEAATLTRSALNTLAMAMAALALAAVAALGLALVSAFSFTVERAVRPLALALQVTPMIAVAPLVAIWAGVAHPERAVVALASLAAFFPIFSGALTGLQSADRDLHRLFALYGASRRQTLFRLRVPASAPFVVEGLRVAAGLAVIGAVVAEFVAGSGAAQGLAWRILEAGNRLQTARMLAAIVALALLAGLLHLGFTLVERRFFGRWLENKHALGVD
ncbi:MAG: ABC transporter permease [Caulobacterales bacterium 68-7]|nr:ABC transporter permease subunit [Caulobacterales bacterium]OJU13309.1 MAG: ABC transporter permease [Caulobacterales bacterium 68-7]